jgi:hypothetical protein
LYKFIADPDVVQFLVKGIVKFTPIPELNDPSELSPSMILEEVQASLARLREKGYTRRDIVDLRKQQALIQLLAPRFQAVRAPSTPQLATALIRSSFYDRLPVLEQLLNGIAHEMSTRVGLFCLSQRYDSLPMWAHYAANAAGLAVEFQHLERAFPGDETGLLREPRSVRYERERSGVTFDPRSHETLFLSKFPDWSYEREVRIVLPLAHCRREMVNGRPLHLYDVPSHCVARLILGWNMAPSKANGVRKLVRRISPHVEVVQAQFVRGTVRIGATLDSTPGGAATGSATPGSTTPPP